MHPARTRRCRRWPARLVALLFGTAAAQAALALEDGVTTQGQRYLSGGVSESEQSAMKAQRSRFALWIETAASPSGAYLSDVQITLIATGGKVVYDAPLDGPWLMIDLLPGTYKIVARLGNASQQRVTTIRPAEHRQVVLHFPIDVPTLPHLRDER